MKKATVLEILKSFGDEVDTEKLIEKLLLFKNNESYDPEFVVKIQESKKQIEKGETRIIDIDDL
ncbi:DUF2683 family protein [Mucilaginibacter oryzae]|nr:DUF2683 family protein [Mucilaginibacter oryzae]